MKKIMLGMLCGLALLAQMGLGQESEPLMGVVEIRGLDTLATSVETMAQTFMLPVQKQDILSQLYKAVMVAPGQGIAPNGNVRAYIFYTPDFTSAKEPPVVLAIPVTGKGEDYLDALEARLNLEEPAEHGILHYTAKPESPRDSPFKNLYVKIVGAHALAGGAPARVERLAGELSAGTISGILPAEGDLAIQFNIAQIVQAFEPVWSKNVKAATERLAAMPAEAANPGPLLQSEYDTMMALLKQVRTMTLGLGIAGNNLAIYSRTEPLPNTKAAEYVQSFGTFSKAAQAVIPPDALIALAGHWGNMDLWLKPYGEFMDKVYSGMGPQMAGMGALMNKLMQQCLGLYDGQVSLALVPGSEAAPFQFVEYCGAKDPAKIKSMMDTLIVETTQQLSNMPVGVKFSMEETGTRQYKEVSVTGYKYTFDFGSQPGFPPALAKILSPMNCELALLPEGVLYAIGPAGLMDAALDRVLAGEALPIPERDAFKARFPEMPETPYETYYVNLFDTVRSFVQLLVPDQAGLVAALPSGHGTMAGYGFADEGALVGKLRIALADLSGAFQFSAMSAATRKGGLGAPGKPSRRPAPLEP